MKVVELGCVKVVDVAVKVVERLCEGGGGVV